MRNIMEALNRVPDGRVPKTGFDLSNFENFTQKGGMLNIVGVRDTVPNSDYRMAVDGFTRSLPCNTANFAHIKENYYFVHVPLALVSHNAYQTLVQRKQAYSAMDMGIAQFPVFPLVTVLNRCLEIAHLDLSQAANQKFKDVHGFNIGRQAFRLFDMLGYGCYLDYVESTFKESGGLTVAQVKSIFTTNLTGYLPTANRLAAYQCVWYHFFRNDIYDCDVSARSFNFDDITYKTSDEPSYNILDHRSVDDFIIECCQLRYVGYKKDIFMGSMPGTQFGPVSVVPVSVDLSSTTATLEGLTGSFTGNPVIPTGSFSGSAVSPTGSFTGRNSHVEVSGTTGDDQTRHRFVEGGTGTPVEITAGSSMGYLPTYQVFEGKVYPNPLASSSPKVTDPDLQMQVQGSFSQIQSDSHFIIDKHDHSFVGEGVTVPQGSISINGFTPAGTININSITPSGTVDLSSDTVSLTGLSGTSIYDVLQLVEAQAIQKWRQKSMLAGNKTADQFRAHHGEVPRHLVDHLPDFIGSVDNEIQITEITSQADTASSPDESNLGAIAGRGYGASNNKVFHFHSDDYGVLMLLHAIVPENTYSSFGFDFGNTMVYYNDFFQTEYQNIGLQAVPKYLLNSMDLYGSPAAETEHGEGTEHLSDADLGIVGYAPRYFNYKQYPSKVHGLFNPSRLSVYEQGSPSPFGYDDMQSFVMPRADLVLQMDSSLLSVNTFTMTLSNLYVHPSLFDSIFAINADESEVTDEFISHVKFFCEASLPMNVVGLPQF